MCQICAIAQRYQSPKDGSSVLSQGILTRTVQLKPRQNVSDKAFSKHHQKK